MTTPHFTTSDQLSYLPYPVTFLWGPIVSGIPQYSGSMPFQPQNVDYTSRVLEGAVYGQTLGGDEYNVEFGFGTGRAGTYSRQHQTQFDIRWIPRVENQGIVGWDDTYGWRHLVEWGRQRNAVWWSSAPVGTLTFPYTAHSWNLGYLLDATPPQFEPDGVHRRFRVTLNTIRFTTLNYTP